MAVRTKRKKRILREASRSSPVQSRPGRRGPNEALTVEVDWPGPFAITPREIDLLNVLFASVVAEIVDGRQGSAGARSQSRSEFSAPKGDDEQADRSPA